MRRIGLTITSLSALLLSVTAHAQEEAPKPRFMQEPGHVTDVIDAFDDDDPFDISASLGFSYQSKQARILRESTRFEPGLTTGGYTSRTQNVGQYLETSSKLIPRLDIGIYKDLALYTRIPIVLSNTRKIEDLDDTAGNVAAVTTGAPGEDPLFPLPFTAPDRSGIEHLAIGIDLGVLNQARDRTKPTWLFGIETRISVGEPMHACGTDDSGEPRCAHPGDINQNGQADDELDSANIESREPGISRGTIGIEVHSLMSKRIKYIEPYGGFSTLIEFQQSNSDYGMSDLEGALVNHPPLVGTVSVGMLIIPWENREDFGRLTFDLRFDAEYRSEGRDYSELFDALGSSSAYSLRSPRWAAYKDNCPGEICNPKSVVDEGTQKTYFTGLTVVEPYGSYRASGSVSWRASEYFKLKAGMAYRFDQAHGISHDQPCNPNIKNDVGRSGPCYSGSLDAGQITATGIPNPAYRPVINAVGRRFYVDKSMTFEVFATGTVMF